MRANELRPVWFEEGKLFILDQTKLPSEEVYIDLKTLDRVVEAIKKLQVRGAPAIGVAAAYGVVVALREQYLEGKYKEGDVPDLSDIKRICDSLRNARPTAVNLFKAVDRMEGLAKEELAAGEKSWGQIMDSLKTEADAIQKEDEEANLAMGEYGLQLLKPAMGILTHCNAGALATSCYGTCLSPIYLGNKKGYDFKVFADETRPLLQGARLTTWELNRAGVDVTLICDNMAQTVMRKGWIDAVVVGCDRMAANGDGANKIGTAALAILAKEFGIPFYMFVPTSTIDLDTPTGAEIEIELRGDDEIKEMWYNTPMAPKGVKTFNPAFDVTPHEYITAVVTEKGIVRPPFNEGLREIMEKR